MNQKVHTNYSLNFSHLWITFTAHATTKAKDWQYIWSLFDTSQKNTTQKKEEGTDRQIYTVAWVRQLDHPSFGSNCKPAVHVYLHPERSATVWSWPPATDDAHSLHQPLSQHSKR